MKTDQHIAYNHVAITVSDMRRSINFYRDLLGFEIMGKLVLQDGKFLIVYLKSGDAVIELFEFAEKGKPLPETIPDPDIGFKHICFTVDDVEAFAAFLKSHGVEFTVEPKKASTSSIHLAFFRDPDGNKIEITSGQPELLPFEPDY